MCFALSAESKPLKNNGQITKGFLTRRLSGIHYANSEIFIRTLMKKRNSFVSSITTAELILILIYITKILSELRRVHGDFRQGR